jgi:thymidylate synthase
MYQRSCDMGLGVPFNIASYSLLTLMIAHVCKIEPGEFILTMGDCHVYKDHVEALETQLQRTPNDFPTLKFKREITNIEDFVYGDFILENYNPQKKIEMTMSV